MISFPFRAYCSWKVRSSQCAGSHWATLGPLLGRPLTEAGDHGDPPEAGEVAGPSPRCSALPGNDDAEPREATDEILAAKAPGLRSHELRGDDLDFEADALVGVIELHRAWGRAPG